MRCSDDPRREVVVAADGRPAGRARRCASAVWRDAVARSRQELVEVGERAVDDAPGVARRDGVGAAGEAPATPRSRRWDRRWRSVGMARTVRDRPHRDRHRGLTGRLTGRRRGPDASTGPAAPAHRALVSGP